MKGERKLRGKARHSLFFAFEGLWPAGLVQEGDAVGTAVPWQQATEQKEEILQWQPPYGFTGLTGASVLAGQSFTWNLGSTSGDDRAQ